MPEGPSIVLLKEEIEPFAGKKIVNAGGNTKIDLDRLAGKKIQAFRSWGKHFLICFRGFTVRIHFLMFGSYRINEQKDKPVRLSLQFKTGEINFYSCAVKMLEGDINDYYDWSEDVMSDAWNSSNARKKLKLSPYSMICDLLLEQEIFSGVGNIIKNEILFRLRIHPESLTGKLPPAKLKGIIEQVRTYSFEFLTWKRNYELKKHWLAHTKKICNRCKGPITKKYTGVKARRSFICENCQRHYK